MSLSAELMFPVRMFLPVAPVFPAAGPLFPMPAAPSVAPGLSFLVQKSLEDWSQVPESVAAPFQGSESPVLLFLWSGSLAQLIQVQLSLLCLSVALFPILQSLSVVRLQFLSEVRFLFLISGHSYETEKQSGLLPPLLQQDFPMRDNLSTQSYKYKMYCFLLPKSGSS